jgi:hypothetical protein
MPTASPIIPIVSPIIQTVAETNDLTVWLDIGVTFFLGVAAIVASIIIAKNQSKVALFKDRYEIYKFFTVDI